MLLPFQGVKGGGGFLYPRRCLGLFDLWTFRPFAIGGFNLHDYLESSIERNPLRGFMMCEDGLLLNGCSYGAIFRSHFVVNVSSAAYTVPMALVA